jgi:hypothetical protein
MGPGTASRFRAVLELAGGITLAAALGMSMLVQVRVWRAVRSDGDNDEHDDFKIRMEQRRQQEIEHTLERQKVIVAKLVEARTVLSKEKEDVKAMHDHATESEENVDSFLDDLQSRNHEGKIDNPLQASANDDEDSVGDDRLSSSSEVAVRSASSGEVDAE